MLNRLLKTGCQALWRDSRLKGKKQEVMNYTVEREFLARITVTELVSRIIQVHVKANTKNEGATA